VIARRLSTPQACWASVSTSAPSEMPASTRSQSLGAFRLRNEWGTIFLIGQNLPRFLAVGKLKIGKLLVIKLLRALELLLGDLAALQRRCPLALGGRQNAAQCVSGVEVAVAAIDRDGTAALDDCLA